jgi:heme/copper-type cytochrome/quinol oxidase subunit 2
MNPTPEHYISSFKWIHGISAIIGISVPALSFFTLYAPPFFAAASVITSGIATAVVVFTFYYDPTVTAPDTEKKKLIRLALIAIGCAVVLIVVYMMMLKVCTVVDPPEKPETRYQIGFWNFEWSLTDDGKYLKQRHSNATPWELMDYGVAFDPDAPAKIWKFWTILVSGVSMIVVFLFAFVLWVFGWSLLAKRKALGA